MLNHGIADLGLGFHYDVLYRRAVNAAAVRLLLFPLEKLMMLMTVAPENETYPQLVEHLQTPPGDGTLTILTQGWYVAVVSEIALQCLRFMVQRRFRPMLLAFFGSLTPKVVLLDYWFATLVSSLAL